MSFQLNVSFPQVVGHLPLWWSQWCHKAWCRSDSARLYLGWPELMLFSFFPFKGDLSFFNTIFQIGAVVKFMQIPVNVERENGDDGNQKYKEESWLDSHVERMDREFGAWLSYNLISSFAAWILLGDTCCPCPCFFFRKMFSYYFKLICGSACCGLNCLSPRFIGWGPDPHYDCIWREGLWGGN